MINLAGEITRQSMGGPAGNHWVTSAPLFEVCNFELLCL